MSLPTIWNVAQSSRLESQIHTSSSGTSVATTSAARIGGGDDSQKATFWFMLPVGLPLRPAAT